MLLPGAGYDLVHEVGDGSHRFFGGDVAPGEDADEVVDSRIFYGPPNLFVNGLGRTGDDLFVGQQSIEVVELFQVV